MVKSKQMVTQGPFWTSACGNHEFFCGNSQTVMATMPSGLFHCAVTSPPYWPLRDYGQHEDHEIGREDSLETYLQKTIATFSELRRVLRDDGTFWLNIGDSRIRAPRGRQNSLPFRLALAMEDNGWILRQDLIWAKPNPLPDGSTLNRCTKAHEYLFLFIKKPDYFFDGDAIREPSGAVKRSVWTIVPEKLGTKHKAIFPRKLVEPCILAGTSEHGCCPQCGAPWKRETQVIKENTHLAPPEVRPDRDRSFVWSRNGITGSLDGETKKLETIGWDATCECGIEETVPCRVIDPFMGSGTVSVVAKTLGRRSVGIDLSAEYLTADAIPRMEKIANA